MSKLRPRVIVSIIYLLLITLLVSSIFTAGGKQEPSELSGNPLQGRNIFLNKGCIKCHAVWSVGGKLGPDLTRVGMGRSFLQIAGSLWSHSPKMIAVMEQQGVPRPTFTPEEMSHLIAYLYYLNYFNESGDETVGRKSFSEKGCIYCHSVGHVGGRIGPALDDYQKYASPLFVAQAMWNHGPRMVARMKELGIKKPTFEGKEMADLLSFIRGQATREIPNQKFMVPGNPVSGRRLFAEKGCLNCHAMDGRGGAIGPDLSKKELYKSVTDIAGALWNHGPQMWTKIQQAGMAQPRFGGNELADIIAYLYFNRYTDRPGDAIRGKALFAEKGCAQCHSLGQGEKIGPDLGASPALVSPVNLMAAMWNHAPTMEKWVQEKGLPWPKFEGNEMRDLVEYIKSFGRSSTRRPRK